MIRITSLDTLEPLFEGDEKEAIDVLSFTLSNRVTAIAAVSKAKGSYTTVEFPDLGIAIVDF